MSKREMVGKHEPNLRPDATTVDGGYPREPKYVNPHETPWIIIKETFTMLSVCVGVSAVFAILLRLGLWESVCGVVNGTVPFWGTGLRNVIIFGVFSLVLALSVIATVWICVDRIIRGERSFSLSRRIRKVWDKNLGQYVYRQ